MVTVSPSNFGASAMKKSFMVPSIRLHAVNSHRDGPSTGGLEKISGWFALHETTVEAPVQARDLPAWPELC